MLEQNSPTAQFSFYIHSLATLLGTPFHLPVGMDGQPPNRMTAVQFIHSSEPAATFTLQIQLI